MSPLLLALSVLLTAFISEDAAGIAAGSMVAHGLLPPLLAGTAVFLGIWVGDLLLFVLGRNLRPLAARWGWARRWLADPRVTQTRTWLDQRTWQAMVITRVVPGSRLPSYVAAGLLGMSAGRFAGWTAIACLLWTPVLMGLGAGGAALLHAALPDWSPGGLALIAVVLVLALVLLLRQVLSRSARQAWTRRWQRRHHEWWPTWVMYVPVVLAGVPLAIRHRCLRAPLLVNPALPDSGTVGESKAAVLHRLAGAPVLDWLLLPAAAPTARLARMQRWLAATGQDWPVILKPDAGERGAGVRLVRDAAAAERWLTEHPRRALAQRYHPGPVEVGIFWTRRPGEPGRILAITDKVFPELIADGHHSIAELIAAHPRFRLQAAIFLERLGERASRLPAAQERVRLGLAGNHAQGCLFRDGAQLITPALTQAVNAWMSRVIGVNYGRFDVRAADYAAVARGQDLAVVELNGLSSEPTAMYDPTRSLWFAAGLLVKAWTEAWAIGTREARRGHRPPTLGGLWRRLQAEARQQIGRDARSD